MKYYTKSYSLRSSVHQAVTIAVIDSVTLSMLWQKYISMYIQFPKVVRDFNKKKKTYFTYSCAKVKK